MEFYPRKILKTRVKYCEKYKEQEKKGKKMKKKS